MNIPANAIEAARLDIEAYLQGTTQPNAAELAIVALSAAAPHLALRKSTTSTLPSPGTAGAAAFDLFWSHYPRKVGKVAAQKAFHKAAAKVGYSALITAAETYAADPGRPRDLTYVPHPSRWLNDGRWEDAPAPTPRTAVADGNRDHWSAGRGFGIPEKVGD